MEGYRIFTVSSERFPAFNAFVSSLKKRGIKVITIVDPGIKVDPQYGIYQEAIAGGYVATFQNKTYVNAVWPGDSVYPAFNEAKVRAWWSEKIASFVSAYALSGIWCDMRQKPAEKLKRRRLPFFSTRKVTEEAGKSLMASMSQFWRIT